MRARTPGSIRPFSVYPHLLRSWIAHAPNAFVNRAKDYDRICQYDFYHGPHMIEPYDLAYETFEDTCR